MKKYFSKLGWPTVFALVLAVGLSFFVHPAFAFVGMAGMILDERLEFCDATALNTGGADTYLIGDVIDLGTARDIGNGEPLYLCIQVDTEVDSAGDGVTLDFTLASDAQAAIADDGTATVHFSTGAIAQADLTAGAKVAMVALPLGSYERYLGILQTTAVEAVTAGKINAFLTKDPNGWKAYPDGI
ncbi:MAG: hypothetical protein RQ754_02875 [Desulfuromonadales bacterium]|nr:hypothetical protein [Desulfuromonadales bacterium]